MIDEFELISYETKLHIENNFSFIGKLKMNICDAFLFLGLMCSLILLIIKIIS